MAHPETLIPLADSLTPAGTVTNIAAADRLREALIQAADADGWRETLDAAWPALAPVAGASPYLAGLMRRRPAHLRNLLEADPVEALERNIRDTDALDAEPDAVADAAVAEAPSVGAAVASAGQDSVTSVDVRVCQSLRPVISV